MSTGAGASAEPKPPLPSLPKGFRVGATTAGIKASGKPDLALIVAERPVPVAAVFTTNRVPAAPVLLSQRHLLATGFERGAGRFGLARAIVSTSGCANAATGELGMADQERLAQAVWSEVGLGNIEDSLALSTGMIGPRLPIERILPALKVLAADGLRTDDQALADVAQALCTTDSRAKWATATVELPGLGGKSETVTVSGVAKGVGMIHPRMATMLAVILTDASATPVLLSSILRSVVARTWNQISVDGDTSTNDTVFLMASGATSRAIVDEGGPEYQGLLLAVAAVARSLARQQVSDGEGATTLISCSVKGARHEADARAVARAVVSSSLFKAAVHGRDPNWGRIAGAAGNAHLPDAPLLEMAGLDPDEAAARAGKPVELDVAHLRIAICGEPVFLGAPLPFDREAVRAKMDAPEVLIELDLGLGSAWGEAFGCDLTEAYVIENSEYST